MGKKTREGHFTFLGRKNSKDAAKIVPVDPIKNTECETREPDEQARVSSIQEQAQARADEFLRNTDDITMRALPRHACTGCNACAAICPVHAIRMIEDEEGFYSPVLDEELCVHCGKCQGICPELNPDFHPGENIRYFAVRADAEDRRQSTGGGFFIAFARQFMKKGGYVCAAVTAVKGKKTKHYISDDPEFAVRYGKAKYMQSDLGDCFPKIKTLLEEDREVLFAGCPCQVAGLKRYLGDAQEGLFTIDVTCRGICSPGSFVKYYEDTFHGEPHWVDFHCKSIFGVSAAGMHLQAPDGMEYVGSAVRDPYFRSYHAGLNIRKSCYSCPYVNSERVGDITLGILYNIRAFKQEWDERLSTSLIKVNSDKAHDHIQHLDTAPYLIFDELVQEQVEQHSSIGLPPYRCNERDRDRFFELLRQTVFLKSLNYAQQNRYDVAVLGLWFGRNYGSMITYYALHQVLHRMGLSVLMISNPLMPADEDTNTKTHPVRFAREHYHISVQHTLAGMWRLNAQADTFIVGSDQLWNYHLSAPYGQAYFLEFVDSYNKKIAYGTSFGVREYNGPEGQRKWAKANLKKFDAISVREEYAVETCKKYFDVDAVKVLDPVFLCEAEEYDRLADELVTRPVDGAYILAYILNPDREIGESLTALQKETGKKICIVLDEVPWAFEKNRSALEIEENDRITVMREVEVREWVALFKYADQVVTDSFHGTCFSVIFKKSFITLKNKVRASERFQALMAPFGLMDRLVEEPGQLLDQSIWEKDIDYAFIYECIKKEKRMSLSWLRNAIYQEKHDDIDRVYSRTEHVREGILNG